MLVIRLSRIGRKNKPLYRLVVQEKEWAPSSKAIEIVGNLNPHTDPATINLKEDRIKHYLANGAQPSATVHNMLVNAKIIDAPKMRSVQPKLKKKKDGEDKEEETKKQAEKQEKPAEDKPKEEAKPAEDKKEDK